MRFFCPLFGWTFSFLSKCRHFDACSVVSFVTLKSVTLKLLLRIRCRWFDFEPHWCAIVCFFNCVQCPTPCSMCCWCLWTNLATRAGVQNSIWVRAAPPRGTGLGVLGDIRTGVWWYDMTGICQIFLGSLHESICQLLLWNGKRYAALRLAKQKAPI